MNKQAYEASVRMVLEKRAAGEIPGVMSNTQLQQAIMRRNGSRFIADGLLYSTEEPRWGTAAIETGLRLKNKSYMPLGIERRMEALKKGINPDAPALHYSDYLMIIPDDAISVGPIPELKKGSRPMWSQPNPVNPNYLVPRKGSK